MQEEEHEEQGQEEEKVEQQPDMVHASSQTAAGNTFCRPRFMLVHHCGASSHVSEHVGCYNVHAVLDNRGIQKLVESTNQNQNFESVDSRMPHDGVL